jgi:hypothetical protein
MNALVRNPAETRGAASEIDFRWGFEPESWVSLRSPSALRGNGVPVSTQPGSPVRRFLPRLVEAARAVLRA